MQSYGIGAGKDEEKTLPSINSIVANNIFTNSTGKAILEIGDEISGVRFKNNFADSPETANAQYFTKKTIDWEMTHSLPVPKSTNIFLTAVDKLTQSPDVDVTGQPRHTYNAGAYNLNAAEPPKAFLTRSGPGWKPNIIPPKIEPKEYIVEPGMGTLAKALKKLNQGDVVRLKIV